MENKSIKRINLIGKISKIVIIITKIIVIAGIISAVLTGIAISQIPDGMAVINGTLDAEATIDMDKVPSLLSIDKDIEEIENLEKLINISNISHKFGGLDLDISVEKTSESDVLIKANGSMVNQDISAFRYFGLLPIIVTPFLLVAIFVILIFGGRLADAFSKCSSPFEENVIRRMKHFGFSMIPWAILKCIASDSIAISTLIFVTVIFLFVQIFSYGAMIQQENDDMV